VTELKKIIKDGVLEMCLSRFTRCILATDLQSIMIRMLVKETYRISSS